MYEIIAAQGKRPNQSYDSYIKRYGQGKTIPRNNRLIHGEH